MVTFGRVFRSLDCALRRRMDQALSGMDLTFSQGHIMGYLAHCDTPPCAKDIEDRFHLSHPTVSGLLSRLEKKDFIELRPDETDRRCKRIYVLPKGDELNETMGRVILDNEAQVVAGFSPEERELFTSMLLRAIDNMGASACIRKIKEESDT